MEVDSLEYYEWIRDQRADDITAEQAREDTDTQLLRLLRQQKQFAEQKIIELTNGI